MWIEKQLIELNQEDESWYGTGIEWIGFQDQKEEIRERIEITGLVSACNEPKYSDLF